MSARSGESTKPTPCIEKTKEAATPRLLLEVDSEAMVAERG